MRKIFLVILLSSLLLPAAVKAAGAYKNKLSKTSWVKYGVNPWRADTDNDAYPDDWEVKNGYCPTNDAKGVRLNSPLCQKGTFDLKIGKYTPPSVLANIYPRDVANFSSCAALNQTYVNNKNLISEQQIINSADVGSGNGDVKIFNQPVNNQVITKGNNIFVAKNNLLYILKNTAGKVVLQNKLLLSGVQNVLNLYIDDKNLVIVGVNKYFIPTNDQLKKGLYPRGEGVVAQIWQVSNAASPLLLKTVELEGNLMENNLNNHRLFLATSLNPNSFTLEPSLAGNSTDLLPRLRERQGAKVPFIPFSATVACSQVVTTNPLSKANFVTITAISVNNLRLPAVSQVFFGLPNQVYLAGSSAYLISPSINWAQTMPYEKTEVFKFNFTKNKFILAGAQALPGTLVGAMGINNNYLTLATRQTFDVASTTSGNNLFVLKSNLDKAGWYYNLGYGQQIANAYFNGPYVFLWSNNLSDPLIIFNTQNPNFPSEQGQLALSRPFSFTALNKTNLVAVSTIATPPPSTTLAYKLKISLVDLGITGKVVERFSAFTATSSVNSLQFYGPESFNLLKTKQMLVMPFLNSNMASGSITNQNLKVYLINKLRGLENAAAIALPPVESPGATSNDVIYTKLVNNYLYNFINDNIHVYSLKDFTQTDFVNLDDLNIPAIKRLIVSKTPETNKAKTAEVLAADKQRLADLAKLLAVLKKYYQEQKMYPMGIGLPLGRDEYNCLNFDGWRAIQDCSYPYMYDIPLDPLRGSYMYTSTSTNNYQIDAQLDGIINGLSGAIKLTPTGISK